MDDPAYIDVMAERVAYYAKETWSSLDENEKMLYRIYAVLALALGATTTLKNVHDAWSAWRVATVPNHRSLVPFDRLAPEVQELDAPYRDAIHRAALAAL